MRGDETRTSVVRLTQQRYPVVALHRRRHAVSQELGLGSQFADDAKTVLGRYVKEGRDRRMVRHYR